MDLTVNGLLPLIGRILLFLEVFQVMVHLPKDSILALAKYDDISGSSQFKHSKNSMILWPSVQIIFTAKQCMHQALWGGTSFY